MQGAAWIAWLLKLGLQWNLTFAIPPDENRDGNGWERSPELKHGMARSNLRCAMKNLRASEPRSRRKDDGSGSSKMNSDAAAFRSELERGS